MSWLDALLGRIRSLGVDVALGNGLNFTAPLRAVRNESTGFVDVAVDPAPSLDAALASDSILIPSGTSLQRAALTGDVTASANSNATALALLAVTTAKLADAAVTTAKVADNAITAAKMAAGEVTITGAGPHHDVVLNADTTTVRVGTTSTVTGFTGGFEGRVLHLYSSAAVTPTLGHATGSSAGNQINAPGSADKSLGVRGGATLKYHQGGWRTVAVASA